MTHPGRVTPSNCQAGHGSTLRAGSDPLTGKPIRLRATAKTRERASGARTLSRGGIGWTPGQTAMRHFDSASEVVILVVMSETMPLAKVKAHLSEVVDRVAASHERVDITRHGHREAVVIAADDLDALEDTLDILSNPAAVRDIAEGREAAARDEGLDLAEVRRRYLGRDA